MNVENVIQKLWDIRSRNIEDPEEILDVVFLAINTLKSSKEEADLTEQRINKLETGLRYLSDSSHFANLPQPLSHVEEVAKETLHIRNPENIFDHLRSM